MYLYVNTHIYILPINWSQEVHCLLSIKDTACNKLPFLDEIPPLDLRVCSMYAQSKWIQETASAGINKSWSLYTIDNHTVPM